MRLSNLTSATFIFQNIWLFTLSLSEPLFFLYLSFPLSFFPPTHTHPHNQQRTLHRTHARAICIFLVGGEKRKIFYHSVFGAFLSGRFRFICRVSVPSGAVPFKICLFTFLFFFGFCLLEGGLFSLVRKC